MSCRATYSVHAYGEIPSNWFRAKISVIRTDGRRERVKAERLADGPIPLGVPTPSLHARTRTHRRGNKVSGFLNVFIVLSNCEYVSGIPARLHILFTERSSIRSAVRLALPSGSRTCTLSRLPRFFFLLLLLVVFPGTHTAADGREGRNLYTYISTLYWTSPWRSDRPRNSGTRVSCTRVRNPNCQRSTKHARDLSTD